MTTDIIKRMAEAITPFVSHSVAEDVAKAATLEALGLIEENYRLRALLADIAQHAQPPFMEGKWAKYIHEVATRELENETHD